MASCLVIKYFADVKCVRPLVIHLECVGTLRHASNFTFYCPGSVASCSGFVKKGASYRFLSIVSIVIGWREAGGRSGLCPDLAHLTGVDLWHGSRGCSADVVVAINFYCPV